MTEARPEPTRPPAPVVVGAVDATTRPDGGILVRVDVRWAEAPEPRPALALLVGAGAAARRLGMLAAASAAATRAAGRDDGVRAIFAIPPDAAALAADGLALDAGGQPVALPEAGPEPVGAGAPPADEDGTVVDRAVLAERRARRAEALEADLRTRVESAEAAADALELELAALEAAPPAGPHPDPRLLAREAGLAAAGGAPGRAGPAPAPLSASLGELLARERRHAAGRPAARAAGVEARPGPPLRQGSVAAALDRLDQERRAAPELRRVLIRREREVAALREQLDRAAADLQGRMEAERAARAAAEALDHAEQGIVIAQAAAETVRRRLDDERATRQAAEEEFQAALERERSERRAIEAALRGALQRERQRAEVAERRLAELEADAGALPLPVEVSEGQLALVAPGAPPAAAPEAPPAPVAAQDWLGAGLRRLAAAQPHEAARLAASLLPATGLAAASPLDCDVRIAETGWYALRAAGDGTQAEVEARAGRLPRRKAQFRLEAGAAGLAELLTTGTGDVRVRGTLRRRRARGRLGPLPADLAALADAGVILDPPALLAALALGADPAWSAGGPFAIEQQVGGAEPFWIVAEAGLRVQAAAPPTGAQAVIRCSHPAFQRMLAGAPPAPDDKPALSGDAAALAALADLTVRARAALA